MLIIFISAITYADKFTLMMIYQHMFKIIILELYKWLISQIIYKSMSISYHLPAYEVFFFIFFFQVENI